MGNINLTPKENSFLVPKKVQKEKIEEKLYQHKEEEDGLEEKENESKEED